MFYGKMKALTFSYDDGTTQDKRLVELFNKYNVKATFHINSGLLGNPGELLREGVHVRHDKVQKEEVRALYAGHEIAAHTLTHPNLINLDDAAVIKEVEEDRLALSELAGYEVVGLSYPCGGHCYDERIKNLLKKHTGIKYSRTTNSTHSFDEQTDLLEFHPTVHHHAEFDKMIELGKAFLDAKPEQPMLFYVWGHGFEFDVYQNWDRFEAFLAMMANKDDIFYGTNKECLLENK